MVNLPTGKEKEFDQFLNMYLLSGRLQLQNWLKFYPGKVGSRQLPSYKNTVNEMLKDYLLCNVCMQKLRRNVYSPHIGEMHEIKLSWISPHMKLHLQGYRV